MMAKNSQRRDNVAGYGNSRFNAVKHGILSKETVLPWENKDAYEALHASLVDDHHPVGTTEEHLVEELAVVILRKWRLRKAEAASYRRVLRDCIEEFDSWASHTNSTAACRRRA